MLVSPQDVKVINKVAEPIDKEELEALLHPSEEVLRAELLKVPALIDRWFESLPKVDIEAGKLDKIVLFDRSHAGEVRPAILKAKTKEEVAAEVVYFKTSAEVWLVRTTEEVPGVARYMIYSWYGMNIPCTHYLSSEGEILDGTITDYSHPAQDLLENIDRCEWLLGSIEIKNQIEGTPQYKSSKFRDFIEANQSNMDFDLRQTINGLPQRIQEVSIAGDEIIKLCGIGPFDRRDLTFYISGTLQLDAVREACPELMQLHDVLKSYGFSPVLEAELTTEASQVPCFSLWLNTQEALEQVEVLK